MISTEGNSLTLKDSLELQKTKAYIPVDWTEATTQLESYLAVLAIILGVTHEVVKGYQRGLLRLKVQQMPLRRAIADKMGSSSPQPSCWLPNVSNVVALRLLRKSDPLKSPTSENCFAGFELTYRAQILCVNLTRQYFLDTLKLARFVQGVHVHSALFLCA
eukprot:jgi/Psemu1/48494/gm1.48494_g